MGSRIIGTGVSIPELVVTNDDMSRVMDTSDEWITSRSGVRQRHVAAAGTGSSDLAATAGSAALENAGVRPEDVDILITATMTPDSFTPGIAALTQTKMGLGHIGAFDIRQQCSGFLYGMDLADAMLKAGRARMVVVVGAETHAGFIPFGPSWETLIDPAKPRAPQSEIDRLSQYRDWAVLFGDGAGAVVMSADDNPHDGLISSRLYTDGDKFDLIQIPGVGLKNQPYIDAAQLAAEVHLPTMKGRELFKHAVTQMPAAVVAAAADVGVAVADIELLLTHQANARIVEGVRRGLSMDPERVPINIDRYANTTAATLPILLHEHRDALVPGSLIGFTAYGAGAHWGAMMYRVPA